MNRFFKNVTFYLLIIIVAIWMIDYNQQIERHVLFADYNRGNLDDRLLFGQHGQQNRHHL